MSDSERAPATTPGAAGASPLRQRALWLALLGATVASRVVVAPGVLYDWDAANYAHAMRQFNVALHQPHPPGYLLYVLLLRLFSWLPGEVAPFITLNALMTAAVLLLFGRLARRHASPALAWLGALAFAVCPQFWHQGAATTIYVAECLCSVATANVAFELCGGRLSAERAALAFGAVIALRPSSALLLGPLMLVAGYLRRPQLRALLRAAAILAATVLAWLVPTVLLSGGWASYSAASAALGAWQLDLGSVFGGASFSQLLPRLRRLAIFVFDAANVMALLIALCAVVLLVGWLRRRRLSRAQSDEAAGEAPTSVSARPAPSRRDAALLAAWLLPPALIYGLHHLPKSGYVLTIVPGVYLIAVWLVQAAVWPRGGAQPARRLLRAGCALLLALFFVLNVYGFARAVPYRLLVKRDAHIRLPDSVLLTGDYGVYALRYRTYALRKLRRILRGMKKGDALLFLMGAHELHRLATYYCPSCWLVASSVDHRSYTCNNAGCAKQLDFGAFQNRVLRRPRRRTWALRTRISASSEGLFLERARRQLFIGLRGARRLVVVTACPPCAVELGDGVRHLAQLELGAGYRARALLIGAEAR